MVPGRPRAFHPHRHLSRPFNPPPPLAIPSLPINPPPERAGSVWWLVAQRQAADTSGVDPSSHPMQATPRLRDDEANELTHREALQSTAPDTEDGLFLVPKVIE